MALNMRDRDARWIDRFPLIYTLQYKSGGDHSGKHWNPIHDDEAAMESWYRANFSENGRHVIVNPGLHGLNYFSKELIKGQILTNANFYLILVLNSIKDETAQSMEDIIGLHQNKIKEGWLTIFENPDALSGKFKGLAFSPTGNYTITDQEEENKIVSVDPSPDNRSRAIKKIENLVNSGKRYEGTRYAYGD